MKPIDATGQRFEHLLLLKRISGIPSGERTKYEYLCDCGKTGVAWWSNIYSGTTRSCGCLRKEAASQRGRKPTEEVLTTQIRNYYQRNARNREIDWNLSNEEFAALIFQPCYYCGILGGTETVIGHRTLYKELEHKGSWKMKNNGVDRLDNAVGYTQENCVTACKRCNQAKNNMSLAEFKEWIARLTANAKEWS